MNNLSSQWSLDPCVVFLNHGSFGACPNVVLEHQSQMRARMEAQPVRFFLREVGPLLEQTRCSLGALLGARSDDLAFVPNATCGVNTVLRSIQFAAGDELLVTTHEYGASRNALDFNAWRCGAQVVVAQLPFPGCTPDGVVDAVLSSVTVKTRLLLIDHVTSQTGLVMPVEQLINALKERGIETLVDGAHTAGMLPLDLDALGAAYYTGNCHKWLCAPKGAAFLHVRRDQQAGIRPLSISHGATQQLSNTTRFRAEFDWTGTDDPTAFLAVPAAIEFLSQLLPGGLDELMARNHALALQARTILCEALDVPEPCPASMIGCLASVPLPDSQRRPAQWPLCIDELQNKLFEEDNIEVPIIPWPAPPKRLLRISAQVYNHASQYETLALALKTHLD